MMQMTLDDIDIYKNLEEQYYCSYYPQIKHNYRVFDLVRISESASSNIGYRGKLGIIQSLSGVDNYQYVMAHCSRADRYWCCGFEDINIVKINIDSHKDRIRFHGQEYLDLYKAFVDWTWRNNVSFSHSSVKKMYSGFNT